jgi:ribulose-5-phosphate 4-epimerase/fuculose-1-phosphate aldolase
METRIPGATENLWDASKAEGLSELETLAYRSNLLGRDRAVANYDGGNTSTKARERDHAGREVDVLWVKGSGTDLATIRAEQFTGLKLDEVLPLEEREQMSDEEMVSYLAACQLRPDMPRGSIETLLHAFVPYPHVDHTHPDAINMICCSEGGEDLAWECFGEEAVWIPYIRPGFTRSKQVGEAVRNNPTNARFILLAEHGLVTWGRRTRRATRGQSRPLTAPPSSSRAEPQSLSADAWSSHRRRSVEKSFSTSTRRGRERSRTACPSQASPRGRTSPTTSRRCWSTARWTSSSPTRGSPPAHR